MSDKKKLVFPSEEWAQANVEKVNSNKAYETAAANWEGDFLFVIEPDESGPKGFDEPIVMYMDLWHGKCRKSYLVTPDNPAPEKVEYEWSGKYSNWLKLLKGEAKDPIKALMQRKFKLKGNMAKILRAVKASKELVRSATLVEEDFEVEYL